MAHNFIVQYFYNVMCYMLLQAQRVLHFSASLTPVLLSENNTVLQSKRVDFEYGVFSAVFTGQTCMSRVINCYSVLSRIGLYISENMDCKYL